MCSMLNISGILPIQKNNVYKPSFRAKSAPDKTLSADTFESSAQKYNASLEYANNKVLTYLQGDNPIEYGVAVAKNGEILEETEGTDINCSFNDRTVLTKNCTIIHGHPTKSLLSAGDLFTLLDNDIEDVIAITKDGLYSRLSKKVGQSYYNKPGKSELSNELEKKILDTMHISYEETPDEEQEMREKYMQMTCADAETAGKTPMERIKEYIYHFAPIYPKTVSKRVLQNLDAINELYNSDARLEIENEFLKEQAEKYNLIYSTNYKP